MRAGQVILPARADELLAGPGKRAASEVVGDKVVAEDVAGRHAELGGHEAGESAGIRLAQRPDGNEVLLGIQLESVAHSGVEVNGQLGHSQQGAVDAQQPHLRPVRRAHHDPPGQAEVPVEPGVEQGTAVDLDSELADAGPPCVRPWLQLQDRTVSVGAEQAERRSGRAVIRHYPGEQ